MSSVEDTWPLPKYDNGPAKQVHAIGVIALVYATLQSAMDRLFLNRAKSEWAKKYYYPLNEEKRSDAITEVFRSGRSRGDWQHCQIFRLVKACRNILRHAESYSSGLVPFPDALLT